MNTKALGLALAASLIASVPAAAQDWSGFYAGVYAGNISGDWQHLNPDGSVYNSGPYSSDRIAGAFAGYNLQRGNMVYGGELAAGRSGDFCFEEFPPECTDTFVDLKGRVGYSTGSVLVYGVRDRRRMRRAGARADRR